MKTFKDFLDEGIFWRSQEDKHNEVVRIINQMVAQKKTPEDIAKHIESRGGKLGRIPIAPHKAHKIANLMMHEDSLSEGNPLARNLSLQKKGYHSVLISPHRKDKSPEENKAATKNLESSLKKKGFAYRKAEGKWDEGGGVGKEPSYHVNARNAGTKGAAELRHFTRKKAKELHQDAFIHVDHKGTGTAHFTNKTADNKIGDRVKFGSMKANTDNPYGETQYKPSRPENKRPKFTFK